MAGSLRCCLSWGGASCPCVGPFLAQFGGAFVGFRGVLGGFWPWAGSPFDLGRSFYPSCLALQEQGKPTSGADVAEARQPLSAECVPYEKSNLGGFGQFSGPPNY